MSTTIVIVCVFTMIIHFSETLALAMRLSGVRTRQVATSISFVNMSFLVSRMSNMLQAPLLGVMVDTAVRCGSVDLLGQYFRWIIFAAFVGNLLGAFFIPTMVSVFEIGIRSFERTGSIPKLLLKLLLPCTVMRIVRCFRLPAFSQLKGMSWKTIPHGFIYLNLFMVAVYAIGVLASLYAGAQMPDYRATAVQLSGIVNGLATIILVIFVDPTGAYIVDQVVHGKRKEEDAKTMVFSLVMGRVLGTLIVSQLLFIAATHYIMAVTAWLARTL